MIFQRVLSSLDSVVVVSLGLRFLGGSFVRYSEVKREDMESITIRPVSWGGKPFGGCDIRARRCATVGG